MATEHVFTVDVEDYFQVYAFEGVVDRAAWDSFPSRVVRNTEIVVDMLARHGATGTFFVLGWIADKHPDLVRRIADAGHEIASHGWWHRKITGMAPDEFREDAHSSRMLLEEITGRPVVGYRAPSFSITPGREWAFDILLETGYRYDSSLFPISRLNYGYPSTPPIPHLIHRERGDLMEFPLATTRLAGRVIPAAGGGYLRHFPYAVTRRAFREHDNANIPAVFYIHPWELDADQPRMPVSWLTKMRHYRNIPKVAERIDMLLSEFKFTSIAQRLAGDGKWFRAQPSIPDISPRAMVRG